MGSINRAPATPAAPDLLNSRTHTLADWWWSSIVVRDPINVTGVTTPPHIHPIRGIRRKESTRRSASSEGGRQLMGSINRAAGSAQTQLIELWHATFLAALLSLVRSLFNSIQLFLSPCPEYWTKMRGFGWFETFCSFDFVDTPFLTFLYVCSI